MYFAQELFNPDILGNTKESEIDWISKQVKRIPMLSHEETIILARRYRDHNDLAAKEKLITSNMRLVLSMFGKYKNKGLSSAELIQEGNLGLIRAVEKFDPDKGYKFSTYSCWWIMQSFVKALGNKGRMIRLPLHVVEDNYKIRKQFSKLQSEVPAYLSATDMCEILNIPQKKAENYLRTAKDASSLNATVGADETEEMMDFLQSQDNTEDNTSRSMVKDTLYKLLDTLSRNERTVLIYRYGLKNNNPMVLTEIGQIMGITRERVRQIENNALRKLRIVIPMDFIEELN
jgi:RNA polymerase primary sigma factor